MVPTPSPSYPPKATSTLTCHLGQNVGLGEGLVGSFPEMYNDPNLLSPQIVLVESRIMGFGIGNTTQGIRNPSIDLIPESKFHQQRLESSTCNPESTAWNPESKIVMDSLIWVDYPPRKDRNT